MYKEHNWQCFIEISSYCQCFNIVIKSLFKTTSFNLLPIVQFVTGGFVFVQHSGSQNNDILLYYLFSYLLRSEPTVNFGNQPDPV